MDLAKVDLHSSKPSFPELIVDVSKTDGQKCERCWHWEMDIGKNPEHPTICGRCVEAVLQFKA
jgi:isoleucyl-tRNA synthetase